MKLPLLKLPDGVDESEILYDPEQPYVVLFRLSPRIDLTGFRPGPIQPRRQPAVTTTSSAVKAMARKRKVSIKPAWWSGRTSVAMIQ